MHVSSTSSMQLIFMCLALVVSTVLCHVPSVGTFTLNTLPNPGFRGRNGTASYLKALAKYAHLVDNAGDNKATSPLGEVEGFNEANDREWLCPVKIGTPGQIVNLDLDTGSADLWVFTPTSGKHVGDLGNRSVYDVNASTTSRHMEDHTWTVTYGDGSFAGGRVFTDNVEIGNLKVKNATVEVATHFSSNLVKNDAFLSGLMGLAINLSTTVSPEELGVTDGILAKLKDQGIDSIGVDLRYHNKGTFTFGKVNASAYTGEMHYEPVVPNKGYWQIEMTTVRYADSDQTIIHSWHTIIDTGTSLMLMGSDDLVDGYWNLVKSAKYSYKEYGYIFLCNETLPDFHFGFTNDWSEFTIPGQYMNYSEASDTGPGWCYGGIQSSNMGLTIMGDVFLKAMYLDFNIAKESVGFARKPLSA